MNTRSTVAASHLRKKNPLSVVGRLDRCPAGVSGLDASILVMIDWSTCPAVERDPDRVSGAWVFRGTRVPVAALFENLENGASIPQVIEWFPGITIDQVRTVLEHAGLAPACSAWLESDPRFLDRVAQARASLLAGGGVRLEDIDPR